MVNEIAERDRAVEERIPTVDREKFRSKFKQQDKREFSELFEEDDVENIEESFKKIVEGGRCTIGDKEVVKRRGSVAPCPCPIRCRFY